MEKLNFVFLAHRIECWNWLLNLRIFNHLHRNSKFHWFWIWLWPIYVSVSVIHIFTHKGFEKVDEFDFFGMRSQTILLRNYAWHFMFRRLRKIIRKRILRAVIFAQKDNNVIGLGALTKAEWLTQGGQWIVDKLGDKLKAALIHGDTLTAATCLKQFDLIRKKYQLISPVFMTGATSKIGRAIALTLAKNQICVKMHTQSRKRFFDIQKEAGIFGKYLKRANLSEGKDCLIWLLGKSKPSGAKLLKVIPEGAIAINFSVPNPLGENRERPRKDLLLLEGGLLAYDPKVVNLHFTMRLRPGLTYACHAATAVHAYKGWTHHEVGTVEIDQLREAWKVAEEIGFYLPSLPKFETQRKSKKQTIWGKLADVPASIIL